MESSGIIFKTKGESQSEQKGSRGYDYQHCQKTYTKESGITEDSSFMDDLDMASIDIFILLGDVEKEFHVKISEKYLKQIDTVGDMADLVIKLKKNDREESKMLFTELLENYRTDYGKEIMFREYPDEKILEWSGEDFYRKVRSQAAVIQNLTKPGQHVEFWEQEVRNLREYIFHNLQRAGCSSNEYDDERKAAFTTFQKWQIWN